VLVDRLLHTQCADLLPCDTLNVSDWKEEETKDKVTLRVIYIMTNGFRPRGGNATNESPEVQKFLPVSKKLELNNDVLYKTFIHDGQKVKKLVLQECFRQVVQEWIHNDVGHPENDKALELATQCYYWLGMEYDVNQNVD
jgi:hypothetical protein